MQWRNDLNPIAMITINTFQTCARDEITTDGFHKLEVLHGKDWHGKCFIFRVTSCGSMNTGGAYYINKPDAYEDYKVAGIDAYNEAVLELSTSMARQDEYQKSNKQKLLKGINKCATSINKLFNEEQ